MRQGNDVGSQYRSLILTDDDVQLACAERSRELYQQLLARSGHGTVTTEIGRGGNFYYAEPYHQQYLAKHPNGLGGTGVACPVGLGVGQAQT